MGYRAQQCSTPLQHCSCLPGSILDQIKGVTFPPHFLLRHLRSPNDQAPKKTHLCYLEEQQHLCPLSSVQTTYHIFALETRVLDLKGMGSRVEEAVREAGALWVWGLLGGGKELPHDTADRAPWQEPEHLSLAPASALHSPMTQVEPLSASGPQLPHVTLEGFEDHLNAQKWALKPHSSLHSQGAYYRCR